MMNEFFHIASFKDFSYGLSLLTKTVKLKPVLMFLFFIFCDGVGI